MDRSVGTLEAFEAEARTFIRSLRPNIEQATLITLSGELGAGKTAYTKAVAKELGIEESITSPTFVLEKVYVLTEKPFKRLIHIDAYRLGSGKDLGPLGFTELIKDSGNLVMLEWPERVQDALPLPAAKISITANVDGSRSIFYAP